MYHNKHVNEVCRTLRRNTSLCEDVIEHIMSYIAPKEFHYALLTFYLRAETKFYMSKVDEYNQCDTDDEDERCYLDLDFVSDKDEKPHFKTTYIPARYCPCCKKVFSAPREPDLYDINPYHRFHFSEVTPYRHAMTCQGSYREPNYYEFLDVIDELYYHYYTYISCSGPYGVTMQLYNIRHQFIKKIEIEQY